MEPTEGREGLAGVGVLTGGEREGYGKHLANDLKHANNTAEINGAAQTRTSTAGVNVFL